MSWYKLSNFVVHAPPNMEQSLPFQIKDGTHSLTLNAMDREIASQNICILHFVVNILDWTLYGWGSLVILVFRLIFSFSFSEVLVHRYDLFKFDLPKYVGILPKCFRDFIWRISNFRVDEKFLKFSLYLRLIVAFLKSNWVINLPGDIVLFS